MMLLILEIIFLKIEQTMQLLSLSSFIFFISFNFPKKNPITSKNKQKNERYHRRYGRGTLGLPP